MEEPRAPNRSCWWLGWEGACCAGEAGRSKEKPASCCSRSSALASLSLAVGCTPAQIAALSNLAGGLVCEQVGVVPIAKELLLEETSSLS